MKSDVVNQNEDFSSCWDVHTRMKVTLFLHISTFLHTYRYYNHSVDMLWYICQASRWCCNCSTLVPQNKTQKSTRRMKAFLSVRRTFHHPHNNMGEIEFWKLFTLKSPGKLVHSPWKLAPAVSRPKGHVQQNIIPGFLCGQHLRNIPLNICRINATLQDVCVSSESSRSSTGWKQVDFF